MGVSKRLRFEVFRRDNHECRYCGSGGTPTNPLVPDHVIPRTLGGTDTADNLVTSCTDCNAGKGSSIPDAPLVAEVEFDAARWTERLAAAGHAAEQSSVAQRAAQDQFCGWWQELVGQPLAPGWRYTVTALAAAGLPLAVLRDCIEITASRNGIRDPFLYMCGVAWRKLAAIQDAAAGWSIPAKVDEARAQYVSRLRDVATCALTEVGDEVREQLLAEAAEELAEWKPSEDEVLAAAAIAAVDAVFWDESCLRSNVWSLLSRLPDGLGAAAVEHAEARLADPDDHTNTPREMASAAAQFAGRQLDRTSVAALPEETRAAWMRYFSAWVGEDETEPYTDAAVEHIARIARDSARGTRSLRGMCGGGSGLDRTNPADGCGYRAEFLFRLATCSVCTSTECGGHVACNEHLQQLVDGHYPAHEVVDFEDWKFPTDPLDPWAF